RPGRALARRRARLYRRAGRENAVMAVMSYLEAGKAALAAEMRDDASVWALGEDLGRGGVFGQYRGLVDEFGPARIGDTPISEATIMGAAVGAGGPFTPADNYGLLRAAIRCDDPVVYMEHKDLWAMTGEVDEAADLPLGKARLVRKGSDVTLVAWSGVLRAVEAALELLQDGPSVEVIDLR